MHKRKMLLGAAAAATVFGMMGVAQAASHPFVLSTKERVVKDTSPFSTYGQLSFGSGATLYGGPEGSATWVGPAITTGDALNFPTNPLFGFWLDANNWSPATVPNGATDVATFNEKGDLAGITAILRTGENVTLAGFNDNTEAGVDVLTFRTGAAANITVPAGGLTINHAIQSFNLSPTEARFFTTGEGFETTFSGSGKITKTGAGDTWLLRPSTHTGGVEVTGGRLMLVGGYQVSTDRPASNFDDSLLGAAGATLTLNGGSVFMREDSASPNAYTFNRPIFVGPNGGEIAAADGESSPTMAQPIFGTGRLTIGDGGDAFLEANSPGFTGEVVLDDYVFFGLQGPDGAMVNASGWVNFGRLDIINAIDVNNNRLGDNAPHYLYGTEINMTDNFGANVSEDIGAVNLRGATNVITIATNGTQTTTLTANAVNREDGGVLYIRGRNLGNAGASNYGRILLDTSPTMIGGVVPWMYGETSASTTANTGNGVGTARPVTYDATRGLRPLTNAEMAVAFGAGNNVLVSGTVAGGTANSVTLTGAGATVTGASTVTSGLVISDTPGQTIGSVNTGSAEAVFITIADNDYAPIGGVDAAANGLTVSGTITTTGGFTKGGYGDLILSGANSISGPIHIGQGRTILLNDNALGTSGDPIRLVSGTYNPEFFSTTESHLVNGTNATLTINKAIHVVGETATSMGAVLGAIDSNTNSYTRVNGNIVIGADHGTEYKNLGLTLSGGTIDINGVISGPGRLLDDGQVTTVGTIHIGNAGAGTTTTIGGATFNTGFATNFGGTTVILRQNNTYTGGTELGPFRWPTAVRAARYIIGTDQPFGTGEVFMNTLTVFRGLTSDLRTIPNDFKFTQAPFFENNSNFKFTGTVDLNVNSSRQAWAVDLNSTVELAGPVKNGGIFKLGQGTMVLSGNNALLSGLLSVGNPGSATGFPTLGGVLEVRSANGLGTGGLVNNFTQVITGSTLRLNPGVGPAVSSNEEVLINGTGVGGTLGAVHNQTGNNTIGDLELTAYLFGAGSLTRNAPVATVRVDAGSSLTADRYIDLSGALIAPPNPNPAPTVPTLRGYGSGTLTKTGGGVLAINGVFNSKTDVGTLSVFNAGARYAYATFDKTAVGGFDVQGGTLRITQGASNNSQAKHTVVKGLTVNTGALAKLDLTNNSLLVDYTGTSPRAAVEALIASGYAAGAWTGAGIVSASANSGQFGLGVGDLTDTGFSGNYLGTPIDGDVTIVRYTRYGDANLDGTTGIADFARLGANFNQPGRWATGDFNYDGTVGIADFSLLGANFNLSAIDPTGRGGAVPEPTTLGVVALGAAGLLARRRRNA